MIDENEKILEATIVKVEGTPNLPDRPKEPTRWQSFKCWLFPHLKRSEELGEAYAEAKVERERSEARKTAEEAAEIAARKDVLRQEEVKQFNDIINDIFADDGLPPGAKAFKLAKLIEKNPQIGAQLEKVKGIIGELSLKRGLNIDVEGDSLRFLREEQDVDAEEAVPSYIEDVPEEEVTDKERSMLLNMPVHKLQLSPRVRKRLVILNIRTIGELARRTEAELLGLKGFGLSSLREVKTRLAEMGLSLRGLD